MKGDSTLGRKAMFELQDYSLNETDRLLKHGKILKGFTKKNQLSSFCPSFSSRHCRNISLLVWNS